MKIFRRRLLNGTVSPGPSTPDPDTGTTTNPVLSWDPSDEGVNEIRLTSPYTGYYNTTGSTTVEPNSNVQWTTIAKSGYGVLLNSGWTAKDGKEDMGTSNHTIHPSAVKVYSGRYALNWKNGLFTEINVTSENLYNVRITDDAYENPETGLIVDMNNILVKESGGELKISIDFKVPSSQTYSFSLTMAEEGDGKSYVDSVINSSNLIVSSISGNRTFTLNNTGTDQECNITVTVKATANFIGGLTITSTADGSSGPVKG